ncbi:MAG: hypothetical protein IGS49_27080 [Chlorogloeopsis fritschii C42_A2020_084]|uniref:hypothetical protein n=1 Tax=Chlorogloeopsis fritschii TaxID=1124 RepID=UPI001A0A6AB0|nr:hypothetical protein [Chlorogloeopsis fritschii]MBF2009012.1 hypothetical protein [Chlorogloeopsis fritschii C42_A2020_084]
MAETKIDPTLEDEYEDKTEEDVSEESEEIAKNSQKSLSNTGKQAAQELSIIKGSDLKLSQEIDARQQKDELELSEINTGGQEFDQDDPTFKKGKEALEKASDSMSKKRTLRNYVAKHWIALTFGVVGVLISATGVTIGLVSFLQAGKSGSDQNLQDFGFTPEQIARIKELVKEWQNKPEDEFWDMMATYVDTWVPSVESQILFMRYTKEMYGDKPWTWDAGQPGNEANNLVSVFENTKKYSSIYQTAKAYRASDPKNPRPPRNATATMCELALGIIRENLLLQSGHELS